MPAMNSSLSILRRSGTELGSAELPAPQLAVDPLASPASFTRQAYTALKNAIAAMDIYRSHAEIRLDERRLAHDFGISRTPVRSDAGKLAAQQIDVVEFGVSMSPPTSSVTRGRSSLWMNLERFASIH